MTDSAVAFVRASKAENSLVASILSEAAAWLESRGIILWSAEMLTSKRIEQEMEWAEYYLMFQGGQAVGTFRFQLKDEEFWPEAPASNAAYIHRVALRRCVAGSDLSGELIRHAGQLAKEHGRNILRLDCEASRPKLRAVYERHGFQYHSDFRAGAYLVARYELMLEDLS